MQAIHGEILQLYVVHCKKCLNLFGYIMNCAKKNDLMKICLVVICRQPGFFSECAM